VEKTIRHDPDEATLLGADEELRSKSEAIDVLDVRAARLERWLRSVENVVFEKELRRRAPAKAARLDALRACEALRPRLRKR
jgi:hypothetical protein